MINKVDELLKLADALLFAPNHLRRKRREALRSALEDVLTPSEAVARLSITQIREIADKCDEGQEPSEYLIAFARAIENATISRICGE